MNKPIYLVYMNLSGLHTIKTLYKEKSKYGSGFGWWDKSGNYGEWKDPYKLGWKGTDRCYEFATKSLKEAKLVWSGAKMFSKIIKKLL